MILREALALDSLKTASVVAGHGGLERDILWAHVVDMPDPAPWVSAGQLLLTTGYAWPADDASLRSLVRVLSERGLGAVGLAVPGYLKTFPAAARAEADMLGLPLIEIPFAIPFAQVTEELHRTILAEQYRIVERSEQIHRSLTRAAAEGKSLADLAHVLGDLLGRSITFEDPDGKLLAFHSVPDHPEDLARRETLENEQSPADLAQALVKSGVAEEIGRSTGPVRVPAMPELGLGPRVVCPIRLGDELVGLVWIIEGDAKLSELDVRAAEHAALVAAVHVAHQRELATTETRLGYASFLSLLEAEDDDPQALERMRLAGFEPDARHRVGICVIPEPLPLSRDGFLHRERIADQLARALRAGGYKPMLTAALKRVIFLLPEGVEAEVLWSSLADASVRMVLGRAHAGTGGARESYKEALSLLNYADGSAVQTFEEALVPRVLMGDTAAHVAFVDHIFGGLRKRKDGPTLEAVLIALARNGFSLKATAEALGIHQNTLRYRLTKALDVAHLDLDDPESRFSLELAARILDFSNKK